MLEVRVGGTRVARWTRCPRKGIGYDFAARPGDPYDLRRVSSFWQLGPEAFLTKMRSLKRVVALLLSSATIMVLVWPVFAQTSPGVQASAASTQVIDDSATWLANFAPANLYDAETADAERLETIPVGTPLQLLEPQRTGRLHVFNPVSELEGWVDSTTVGPGSAPTMDDVLALRNPPKPSFEPWWGMTHTPAVGWSAPDSDAQAWVRIPQWRYLRVVSDPESGRVLTIDPRNNGYAYVEISSLGPVGAPPEDYFADAPADDQTLSLPGRIIGNPERYERPEKLPYYALEAMSHSQPVTVQAALDRGDQGRWYRIGENSYVPESSVRVPRLPQRTFPGRWIDADLNEPVMVTAYEGERPIYAALAVKGTEPFRTPTGVFSILRRVANETMDSATLGIPRTSPNGYYLKDVLFTQYFTGDGAALHYNYWRSNWGYTGSHGCLGMNYDDSKFFWDFGTVGTTVYVHF
jgi:hypothetical protein